MSYKKILVAVDLTAESKAVADKAREVADLYKATLTMVHVVEPVVIDNANEAMPTIPYDIETTLVEHAKVHLDKLAQRLKGEVDCKVEHGSVKREVFRLVEENNIDLIVVGTHGRHGVGLLLGSTANAILHGTPCDVLAVKIEED
jgi:universal stress protein A